MTTKLIIAIISVLISEGSPQMTVTHSEHCTYTFYVPRSTTPECGRVGTDDSVEALRQQVSRLQDQVNSLLQLYASQQNQLTSVLKQLLGPDTEGQHSNNSGYAAGSGYMQSGGLSEYICLPSTPQWRNYLDGQQAAAKVYGAEYQIDITYGSDTILSTKNNGYQDLHDHDVPCVHCLVQGRTVVRVFAGLTHCPAGWYTEYIGYLMSEKAEHQGRAGPVCMDSAPEVVPGGGQNRDGVLFYFVQAACGSLPCPPYVEGREITCVVCSR